MITGHHSRWSQELRVIEGHRGEIRQVVVSPDGSLLASCSDNKTIKLWDIASGASLIDIDSDSDHLMFSTDGSKLLSLPEGSDVLQIWTQCQGTF